MNAGFTSGKKAFFKKPLYITYIKFWPTIMFMYKTLILRDVRNAGTIKDAAAAAAA
jgi:hypothetical protein